MRGGAWSDAPGSGRAARRHGFAPSLVLRSLGLRLVFRSKALPVLTPD